MAKVLIGKGLAPAQAGDEPQALSLLQLPNPATGAAQQFVLLPDGGGLLLPDGGGLLEVNRVRHEYGAWLVEDRLIADGSAYLCSPMDPTYMLLALLDQQQQQHTAACGDGDAGSGGSGPAGMFQEASSLLCIDEWPGAAALEPLAEHALPLICDVKSAGGDAYYRLSDARALAWMRAKLRQTLEGLRAAAPGSVAGLAEDDARAYALGFMSEYLTPRRLTQLAESCGLAPAGVAGAAATPAVRPAAAAAAGGAGVVGMAGAEGDATQQRDKARKVLDPKEAVRKKQEEGRAAAAAARLAKQAEGTRKISSFFTKK